MVDTNIECELHASRWVEHSQQLTPFVRLILLIETVCELEMSMAIVCGYYSLRIVTIPNKREPHR